MSKLSWLLALAGTFIFPTFVFAQISSGENPLNSSSPLTSGTTSALFLPPAAPSYLNKTVAPTQNSISISWKDNSLDETHFNLERQIYGTNTWNYLAQPLRNETTSVQYTDTAEIRPSTSYLYRVRSCKEGYGCSEFTISPTITTPLAVETTFVTAPTNLSATLIAPNKVQLTWVTPVNSAGTLSAYGYKIFRNDSPLNTVTTNEYTDTSVALGTSYTYYVIAFNSTQTQSQSSNKVLVSVPASTSETTPSIPPTTTYDTTPPTPPTELSATLTSSNQIHLFWRPSLDNVGVNNYYIFRNGVGLTFSNTTEFTDASVVPGQTYNYYVLSRDTAQNQSGKSNFATITVPANLITIVPSSTTGIISPPTVTTIPNPTTTTTNETKPSDATLDTIPPTPPSSVRSDLYGSFVKISWSPSLDNQGVYGYKIYRNGSLHQVIVDNTSFIDNSITKGNHYVYYVVAVDLSRNHSLVSNKAEISIPAEEISTPEISSSIKGQILDADGNPVARAAVHIWNSEAQNFYAPTDLSGYFSISSTPAGNYKVEIILPPARTDLIKPTTSFTTLIAGEIRVYTQTIEMVKVYEKIVEGSVTLPNGRPIIDAKILAYNRTTNQWVNVETNSAGIFNLNLSNGTWYLNIKPTDPAQNKWFGDQVEKIVVFGNNEEREIKKINFVVKEAGVEIKISLKNEASEPISNAGVSIENTSESQINREIKFQKAGPDGQVAFWATPGKYVVRAFSTNAELINPDDLTKNFAPGLENNVVMTFKNKQAARGILSGTVVLSDGTPIDGASVWGWSEFGNNYKTETDTNGNFYIGTLPNDKWHISAGKVLGGFPYRSSEIIIKINGLSGSAKLVLFKPINQLPPVVQIKQSVADPAIVVANTGASIYVPSNAAATSDTSPTSSVTVTIEAGGEAPSRADARVVGNAYDIKVEDSNGKKIDKFESDLEITLPYTDEMLKTNGVKESAVVPGYFDEETGVWVRVTDYVINKEKKVIVLRIKHLTRFALLSSADITPPQPPTKISYAIKTPGNVTLNWTNPSSDFHHIKVYRSDKKTLTGTLINDLVTSNSYVDASLKKITYYYTLKTVDAAGNESQKALTATVNAAKINVLTKVPSNLKLGSNGEGVRLLQEILIKAGALPKTFVITGKFDKATQSGVKTFQKNNKISQVGTVGPITAKALNKLVK